MIPCNHIGECLVTAKVLSNGNKVRKLFCVECKAVLWMGTWTADEVRARNAELMRRRDRNLAASKVKA